MVEKRFTVLCVDSEVSSLQEIQALLEPEFDVSTATTAELGMDLIAKTAFDVVCCDGRLKGTDALEFLRLVSQKTPRSELVYFTSTRSLFLDASRVASADICYLFKPWKPAHLLETIRSLAGTAASKVSG